MESLYLVGIAVLALFGFMLAIVLFNFFGLWLRARIANAPVSLGKMVGMRLRKVPVGLIVAIATTAEKAGRVVGGVRFGAITFAAAASAMAGLCVSPGNQ